ncbi:MAG TPA: hypothetical protein PLE12_03385 [Propionicimonas sp.]|nr:hypothetical protein [Propionicimonas sp.]
MAFHDSLSRRSLRVLLVSLSVTIMACNGVTFASGDTTSAAERDLRLLYPDVVPSADLSGEPFTAGVVTDPAGKPAEGAVVALEVWPDGRTVRKLKEGDPIPVTVVAKAVTDAAGLFTLRVEDTPEFDQYLKSAQADFQIVTRGEEADAVTAFSGEVIKTGRTVKLTRSTLDGPVRTTVRNPRSVRSLVDEQNRFAQKATICAWYKTGGETARPATIAEVYSKSTKVTTDYSYTAGYSSTLGVGAGVTIDAKTLQLPAGAKMTASGVASASNEISANYTARTGKLHMTFTKTAHYYYARRGCATTSGSSTIIVSGVTYDTNIVTRPSELDGAVSTTNTAAAPTAPYCTGGYEKNATVKTGTGTTYASGVDLSVVALVGIDLSSQTNWTAGTYASFSKTGSGLFAICGTKARPSATGVSPGTLVVQDA